MSDTIQYVTQGGERWDTVSFKMYGTVSEVQRIVDANPAVPVTERLTGGTVLDIPVLEENNVAVDKMLLPPWKR